MLVLFDVKQLPVNMRRARSHMRRRSSMRKRMSVSEGYIENVLLKLNATVRSYGSC